MSSPFGPTGSATPQEPAAEELVIGGKPKARRGIATAVVLIATGAIGGGILASTVGASASSSLTSATAADAAASSSAPAPSSAAPKKARPAFVAPLSGKVTAVGTDTVTIATTATSSTPSTTQTYSVTSTTRISINESGPGALTGVKVGDTVSFMVTTKGGTVLAELSDGKGAFGGGFGGGRGLGRGPGGPGFGGIVGVAPETGTVTAVGTGTVTIKTSAATTTYSVTTTSHILKPGTTKPTLTDIKVGDSVFFTVTTKGGTVIANLVDGKLPTIAGHAGPGFGPGRGFGGGNGQGPQAPAASPSASTAATNT
ncbi:MAG TPA: hypothetical protein VK662_16325 [Acidothermaceae bacterium]|jgi:hypothetical protein|nr:hypothetical protein [Acidothermaceae bacterium]